MNGAIVVPPAVVDPIEVAVRTILAADPAVAALVGTRIFQLIIPQGSALPALRLQLVDEPADNHLRGANAAKRARVQIDCFGNESAGYMPLTAIAAAVDAVMMGRPPVFVPTTGLLVISARRETRRAVYESVETRTIRMLLEYLVWSSPESQTDGGSL